MDIFFITSDTPVKRCKKSKKLMRHIRDALFDGDSEMSLKLGELLRDYQMRLDNQRSLSK